MSNKPATDQTPFIERAIQFSGQFATTLLLHRKAYEFIREYRPWQGLHRYGWSAKILIAVAIIISIQFFSGIFNMVSDAIRNPQVFGAGVGGFFTGFSIEKFDWMLHGGKKYLVLIVLEIVVFHFIQRTLEIRMGREPDRSFQAFLTAEKRMIRVAFITWIMENVTRVLVNIPIGILGLDMLEQPAGLVIQFYFLGFAFIDNYHECFRLTIKESRQRTWQVSGIAIAAGLVAYLLMFVPLVGVVASTMLGAVTAAMAMEHFLPLTPAEVAQYELERQQKQRKKQKKTNSLREA